MNRFSTAIQTAALACTYLESEDGQMKRSYYPIGASLHTAGLATLTHTSRPVFFLNEIINLDKTYRPFMIIVTGKLQLPISVPNIKRKYLNEIIADY